MIYIYIISGYVIVLILYLTVFVSQSGCKAFLISDTHFSQCSGSIKKGSYFCHRHSKWWIYRGIILLISLPPLFINFFDIKNIDNTADTSTSDSEQVLEILLHKNYSEWEKEIEEKTGLSFPQAIANAKIAKEESFHHVEKAQSFTSVRDHINAFSELEKGANKGNANAKSYLGCLYFIGLGCEVDSVKGFDLILEAVEDGVPMAQYNVGVYYENDSRIDSNFQKAAYWYKRSAMSKYKDAQKHLADLYRTGIGVAMNLDSTIFWYEQAAKLGDAEAEFMLGTTYLLDLKDYNKSFYWHNRASSKGNMFSKADLALQYFEGLGVAQDYKKAEYLLRECAEYGIPHSMYNLGKLYSGENKNSVDTTLKYYNMAAAIGHTEAQRDLGTILISSGKEMDSIRGSFLLEIAANKNDIIAQVLLSTLNSSEGKKQFWMEKAADSGDQLSQIALSYYYAAQENYDKAHYWKDRAISNDLSNTISIAEIPEAWKD